MIRLAVVGDALLDRDVEGRVERLSPDAPVPVLDETERSLRPGGAGLAATLAVRDGHQVTLVTALARDAAGGELEQALRAAGVELVDLGLDGQTPEKVRFLTGGRPLMRLDRGDRSSAGVGPPPAEATRALAAADAVLVSDYGGGVAAERGLREALQRAPAPVVWDPHPRGARPAAGVTVATPNESEVARLEPEPGGHGLPEAAARAERLRAAWGVPALCMTRGAGGALLVDGGATPLVVPALPADGGDPCGAGDRFSSRLAAELAAGASLDEAVREAVECASAFVAGTGRPGGRPASASAGGAVVATGGCFDLLHAGHVRTLEAARRLGDRLVVLLNSDESIRRIKGPSRPLVPQEDRASVLLALDCVDEVVVFDEDTPVRALEELRPQVWVKGGDYRGMELPEDEVVRRWGGRTAILPYVDGRSTSRLIDEAAARG